MKHILSLFLLLILCHCLPKEKPQKPAEIYQLIPYEDLLVESFDSLNQNENRYSLDNKVFKIGNEFVYSYEYFDKDGEPYYFKMGDQGWHFIEKEAFDSAAISAVKLKVLAGEFYQQSKISYTLHPNIYFSMTGIIENKANVWMHPPREALFGILELNPFPYVEFPLETGKKWTWNLTIGDHWGDKRWLEWEGRINNQMQYEIVDRVQLNNKLGKLNCYKILATASNRLGKTELLAYFNEEYGFVRMNYKNIDGSLINLELTERNYQEPEMEFKAVY
jgi:hypothetical protein